MDKFDDPIQCPDCGLFYYDDPEDSFTKKGGPETNSELNLTELEEQEKYMGLTFKRNEDGKMTVKIAADHPVTALANLIGKSSVVNLPGQFNEWSDPKRLILNEKTGELEGVIEKTMSGEKTWDEKNVECKISISPNSDEFVNSNFDDGGWKEGKNQVMTIYLEKDETEENRQE